MSHRLFRSVLLALALPGAVCAQTAMKSATWWNPAESGWGVFTIDQGSVIAPGWFTYDTDGEPVWFLVPGAAPQPDGSYKGDIMRFTGVPFAQIQGSAADPAAKIGEATLRFDGDKAMTFTTVIGGTTQTKNLTRFNFSGSDLVCRSTTGPRTSATNYSDLYSSPGSSGWGVHLSHLGDAMFATWYTYDTDREAIFLIGSLSRQGDGSFSGPLVRQRNGTPFPQIAGNSPSTGSDPIGTLTVRFSDGETATFSYTVGNVTQTKTIKRTQFGGTASICTVEPYVTQQNPGGGAENCFPPYTVGDVRQVRTTSNGAVETHRERIAGPGSFNGQSGLVEEYDQSNNPQTGGAVYTRNYVANGNGTRVSFGAEALNGGAVISTSVNDPARIEFPNAMNVGQTHSLAWKVRASASGFATTVDLTTQWKLIGKENVTVPAGTFPACKFEVVTTENSSTSGVTTDTDLAGTAWTSPSFGLLKQVTTGTSRVTVPFAGTQTTTIDSTTELLSATVGGQSTP